MLEPGDRVLAGVSGGADSVCSRSGSDELGYKIAIAHVNHGLRGADSDEDERFTAALAAKPVDAVFPTKSLTDQRKHRGPGAMRDKDFFSEVADQHGFTKIALAHTRNDRVETFLLNLLRGAGTEGLVSMPRFPATTIGL